MRSRSAHALRLAAEQPEARVVAHGEAGAQLERVAQPGAGAEARRQAAAGAHEPRRLAAQVLAPPLAVEEDAHVVELLRLVREQVAALGELRPEVHQARA